MGWNSQVMAADGNGLLVTIFFHFLLLAKV